MVKLTRILTIVMLFVSFVVLAAEKKPIIITMALGGGDLDKAANEAVAKEFNEANSDVQVKLYDNPKSTNDIAGLYGQVFEAKSGQFDIMQFDSSWLGGMADNLVDLNIYGIEEVTKPMFPNMVHDNFINGKLVAVPFYADAGEIFYRKDLIEKYGLEIPETWEELTKAAYKIQEGERKAGNPDFVGFVWQGNAYEGLTCDALEWIHSFGGGRIISEDKKVTLNNPKAIAAIKMAANWIGTISPTGVLGMNEDKSLAVFTGGNAAFLRSWPYVFEVSEEEGCTIKGKVGVMPIPSKYPELRSGIAGFESLAINKYSKNPAIAAKVLKYYTSVKGQKIRAMVGGLCPTVESLYEDKEVMQKNPTFTIFLEIFENTFSAPKAETGKHYNEVSTVFFRAVHNVLLGKDDASSALASAANQISKITGFPQGLPSTVAVLNELPSKVQDNEVQAQEATVPVL